jgi:mono/diheme cytochrome c family protein
VTFRYAATVVVVLLVSIGATAVRAGDLVPDRAARQDTVFGSLERFGEQGGESIYRHVCAGCHMPDGKGAVGAGVYPALAEDERLAAAGYPVTIVLHGRKAMPPLGQYLSDSQVAEVVDFIRTHFGNAYADPVTESDVEAAR